MQEKRQGPTWWNAWVPLLLLGGLLVLERQAPLSPGGHRVVELMIALLLYGLVMCWLWYTRDHHWRQKGQKQAHKARKSGLASAMSDFEPWEDSWLLSQRNGHRTDTEWRRGQ